MQNLIAMIPTILLEYAMDVICYLIRRDMGMMPNYQLIKHISQEKKRLLRSDGLIRHCIICTVTRSFGSEVANSEKKRGRQKSDSETTPNSDTIKVCSRCYENIYAGCHHQYSENSYQRKKVYNLEKLIATPTTSERLTSRAINRCSDDMSFSTLSYRKRLVTAKEPPRKNLLSADDMNIIRKDLNLTSRGTLTLVQYLRMIAGSKVVESLAKEKTHYNNHKLDSFFEHKELRFTREIKGRKIAENFEQYVIVAKNISCFIDEVIKSRGLDVSTTLIRIELDGGGGFIKIFLSLFDLYATESVSKKLLCKKFKNSGVKKVFIVGIAPKNPENYYNLKKLWLSIGLNSLEYPYTIVTDLKLSNTLPGLMSHSSIHPCCWCNVGKYHLNKKGTERTFASICKLFCSYFDAQVDKSKAKDYGNVVHLPLINIQDDTTPVVHLVPPPELHLMLVPVNTLFEEISKVWPGSEE